MLIWFVGQSEDKQDKGGAWFHFQFTVLLFLVVIPVFMKIEKVYE